MHLTRPLTLAARFSTKGLARPSTILTLSARPRLFTTNMGALNGTTNGAAAPTKPRTNLVSVAQRLDDGRALAQDVWSIFKYVSSPRFLRRSSLTTQLCSAANLPADCINLGQGYMNFAPPQWIKDAAGEALGTVVANHYSHPRGRIRLREAIRDYYQPLLNRDLDVNSEILVTSGANEGEHYRHFTRTSL